MTSPVNSETKEARTMKLCTVIAYYITSITKELKFLNFHCSIVCSYCSVVCLIAKSELKSAQIFKFFKLNEIYIVDSPFNKDPQNIIFFQGGSYFGGGAAGNFDPLLLLNSETKEPRTIELCTVIAYYVTIITKQLKFLNSHCSIVCSYCPVVCLIAKSDQIFKFFQIKQNSHSSTKVSKM